MSKSWFRLGLFAVTLTLIISGCSSGTSEPKKNNPDSEKAISTEPVTIKLLANKTVLNDEDLERYIVAPVKQKYPHITIERINSGEKGTTLNELVTANQTFDIYAEGSLNSGPYVELGLPFNIEELIKKHKFDLNRIRPEAYEAIKIETELSYLSGLPMWNQSFALFYNKDLFNRFGVAYPKDGMTWDEVRDVAVKLTRSESGVQYYGLYADNVFRGAYQMSLPWIDLKENKAVFQTQGWKDIFEYWYSLYKIPGIAPKGTNYDKEFNEGRIAMRSGSANTLKTLLDVKDLNWDLVTYPTNPKAPGVGQRVDSYSLFITNQSKQKDAAFQVLSVVLSDEVQLNISRNARLSILNDAKIQDEFGKNISAYQSKNAIALTKLKLAKMITFRNLPAAAIANDAFTELLYGNKDVNTVLREADEKMNQAIRTKAEMKK